MQINYGLIDRGLGNWESRLNQLDWIPYVHFCSGALRVVAATVQIVAGLALTILQIFEATFKESFYELRKAGHGITYSIHGTFNFLRGALALAPWSNLLLLSYDALVGRWNYLYEKIEKGVYPLNLGYL